MPPHDPTRTADQAQTSVARDRLAATARALADAGAHADALFPDHLAEVPAELATVLAPVLRPPDRTTGRSTAPGLLGGFDDPGPTPADWRGGRSDRTRALDIALVLLAAWAGRVFGWPGQQDGRLVHNILPSRGCERQQVGASSTAELLWHTEDAFHPRRAELVLLGCVRNEDAHPCRVASVRRTGLAPGELAVLRRRLVAIGPDDSYPQAPGPVPHRARRPGTATVWYAEDGACLRYDPAYSRFLAPDPCFRAAYAALGRGLEECGEDVPLAPGDVLLIDNDIAVHGRAPFRARYDGTDRWLKRVLVRLPRPRPDAERAEPDHGQVPFEPQGGAGVR